MVIRIRIPHIGGFLGIAALLCFSSQSYASLATSVLLLPTHEKCVSEPWPQGEKAVRDELGVLFDEVAIGQFSLPNCHFQEFEQILSQNPNRSVVYLGAISDAISDTRPALHLWLWEDGKHHYQKFSVSRWKDAGAISFAVLNMSEQIAAARHLRAMQATQLNAAKSSETPVAPPPPKRPETPNLLFFGVGGGILGIPDFGHIWNLMVDITWRPFRYVSFSTRGASSLTQSEISFEDRSIFTQFFLWQGWLNLDFANSSAVTPTLGVGGGVVLVKMKGGDTGDQEVSESGKTTVAYIGSKASLRIRLNKLLYLHGGFQAGMQLPSIEVEFPHEENQKLHPLMMEGFLSLEILLRR